MFVGVTVRADKCCLQVNHFLFDVCYQIRCCMLLNWCDGQSSVPHFCTYCTCMCCLQWHFSLFISVLSQFLSLLHVIYVCFASVFGVVLAGGCSVAVAFEVAYKGLLISFKTSYFQRCISLI